MKAIALNVAFAGLILGAGQAAAADTRSYVAGNFFFNLEGVKAGFLKSVEGGGVTADVISETGGATYYVKKHIGTPKYEDFTMQLGFNLSRAVYDWIAASWRGNFQRRNGSVISADFKGDAISERQFFNSLITETGIPACDGSSKEPAYLTLKLTPEFTRSVKASGKLAAPTMKQALWLPSNFRLRIDGLDTRGVAKIDAFTVKQTFVADEPGQDRFPTQQPGKLEFPNLKIELADSSAQTWHDWHEDFVIKGNNGEDKEKGGTLEFLSPNRGDVLMRIHFFNVGIYALKEVKPDDDESALPQPRRVRAELYVERMEIEFPRPPS